MSDDQSHTPQIDVETIENVRIFRLNDPASRNALSEEFGRELNVLLTEANNDPSVRAVVLTGAGKGFCSGAKLEAKPGDDDGPRDLGEPLRDIYNPLMRTIRDLNVPFIVAVNGAAAGIGSALALSGDLILASEDAFFLPAFSKIGLVPDGGATYFFAKSAGRARAMEMALLDERIPAQQALDWGLINRVVQSDQLMPTAIELATKLANGPTVAYAEIRKLVLDACESKYSDQLDAEAKVQTTLGYTEDHRAGVMAFMTKTPPHFQGK